jgi:hypothetical protein
MRILAVAAIFALGSTSALYDAATAASILGACFFSDRSHP